jgi:hypothetical protein
MSEFRLDYDSPAVARVEETGASDNCSATHSTTNGRYNPATSPIVADESGIRSLRRDESARFRDARYAATRACRDIYARYNWVRLDESFSREVKSDAALSSVALNCTVFETQEPSGMICCSMFGWRYCVGCPLHDKCLATETV